MAYYIFACVYRLGVTLHYYANFTDEDAEPHRCHCNRRAEIQTQLCVTPKAMPTTLYHVNPSRAGESPYLHPRMWPHYALKRPQGNSI